MKKNNGNSNGNGRRRVAHTLKDKWCAMKLWAELRNMAEVDRRLGFSAPVMFTWKRANIPRDWQKYADELEEAAAEEDLKIHANEVAWRKRNRLAWADVNFEKTAKEASEAEPLDGQKAATAAKTWDDIGRTASGESTATVDVKGKVEVKHTIGMTSDELERLAKILCEEAEREREENGTDAAEPA